MKKTFPIVMLPTEKATKLYLGSDKKLVLDTKVDTNPDDKGTQNQDLYITSDENSKEGDCILHTSNLIGKVIFVDTFMVTVKFDDESVVNCQNYNCQKIIASTDESLGLERKGNIEALIKLMPRISESFKPIYMKAYNEGNPITEVDLEMDFTGYTDDNIPMDSKGNIFEEYSVKISSDNTVIIL